MQDIEEQLVRLFATALLRNNCRVGLGGTVWLRMASRPSERMVYYIRLDYDSEELAGEWATPEDVTEDILNTTRLRRKSLNDLTFHTFHPETDNVGVTWRMLKIDLPFLRMIFSTDSHKTVRTLRQITDRMVELIDQAMEGDEDGKWREPGSGELLRDKDRHPDESSGDDKGSPPPVQPEA